LKRKEKERKEGKEETSLKRERERKSCCFWMMDEGDKGSSSGGSGSGSGSGGVGDNVAVAGPAVLVSDPNAAYEFYVKQQIEREDELRSSSEAIDETEAHINKIVTNIYVGDIWAASNRDVLKRLNITHIVCAAKHVDAMFPEVPVLELDLLLCSCQTSSHSASLKTGL